MDLKDLKMFLHLSRTLHFGKSSRELHISASGLTRAIQRLEQECGATLFERDKRTVKLTDQGAMLRDFASDVTDRWAVLSEQLHADGQVHGVLSLFCSVTASYSFLHGLLQRFRNEYPRVELQLHTGDSAQAIARVADGMDSLAIAARPERLPDNISFLSLGDSPLVCIGPATDCPLRDRLNEAKSTGIYNWQQIPLIVSETGLSRVRLEQWFHERSIRPRIYAQVSGHEAMVSMVSLGFGLAVVPRVVVDSSPVGDLIEVLPLMSELEPFTIGLCALHRKLSNPLVKAFWGIAEASVAPLQAQTKCV